MKTLLALFFGFLEFVAFGCLFVMLMARKIMPEDSTGIMRDAAISFIAIAFVRFQLKEVIQDKCEKFVRSVSDFIGYRQT